MRRLTTTLEEQFAEGRRIEDGIQENLRHLGYTGSRTMNAVIELIEKKRGELAELCHRYGVERLYLFGSAATGRFHPPSSDLDFIVEMAGRQPNAAYADRYLGFAEELERLFGRSVDLITEQSIRNPYFRREVEATRQLVYGQPREEAAV